MDVFRILLACCVKVDKKSNAGLTAFTNAATYGHLKVYELLLTHNAKVNNKTNIDNTPLKQAARARFAEV